MEHRWGMRRTLNVGVKVIVQQGQPSFGRLTNASASGAYVATSVPLPTMTRVHVALGWDETQGGGRHRIGAYVVRADRRGIGIEWQEFAPAAVLALIDSLETALRQQREHVPAGGKRPLLNHYVARSIPAQLSGRFRAHG